MTPYGWSVVILGLAVAIANVYAGAMLMPQHWVRGAAHLLLAVIIAWFIGASVS